LKRKSDLRGKLANEHGRLCKGGNLKAVFIFGLWPRLHRCLHWSVLKCIFLFLCALFFGMVRGVKLLVLTCTARICGAVARSGVCND
jgi:hypothetical protein